MIRLMRPSTDALDRYLSEQARRPIFSEHAEIPDPPPAGYDRNHHRACLGTGETTFAAARAGLSGWKQFPGGWIDVHDSRRAAHVGQTVAVVARCLGLWSVNACRVMNIDDSVQRNVARFAITYATVAGHMLEGAEQFCIEWDRSDGRVWYDLSSYSRPRHPLAKVLHPEIRRLQHRFASDSLVALQAATCNTRHDPDSRAANT